VLKNAGAPTHPDCNIQPPCLSQAITTGGNSILSFDSTVLTLANAGSKEILCLVRLAPILHVLKLAFFLAEQRVTAET
jgi:hypothetical protein